MKTLTFKNPKNFKFNPKTHTETNTDPSKTKMNQTYTIKELFEKHASGVINIDNMFPNKGQFVEDMTHDSFDMEKFNRADLFQKEEMRLQQATHVQNLKDNIIAHTKAKKEADKLQQQHEKPSSKDNLNQEQKETKENKQPTGAPSTEENK